MINLNTQIDFAAEPERNWSNQQLAVFDAVRANESNLLISAVAGSGKTTTLVQALNYTAGPPIFLAFNKSIADALKTRTGQDVKTLNALGHGIIMRSLTGRRLEARKTRLLADPILGKDLMQEHGFVFCNLVGLMKNSCIGIQSPDFRVDEEDILEFIREADLDIPEDLEARFAEAASIVLFTGNQTNCEMFDFDDQLYWPCLFNLPFPSYHTVFIDEAQDLSPLQHRLVERLNGERVVAVGDRFQAIYGFRGADANSMDTLKKHFSMQELPLSVSYRCSQAVVGEAQMICPDIQASSDAPFGLVGYADSDPELFKPDAMILCRNNAPLFRAVFRHLKAKSPCQVRSNALSQLTGLISSFKAKDPQHLIKKLTAWETTEVERALKIGRRSRLALIRDRVDTIKVFAEECDSIPKILSTIKSLGYATSGPIFSTIHKAKGLESDFVYLLRPDLLPSVFAFSDAAKQQEANLQYVAITRAKSSFTYGFVPQL